ncbi:MAG: BMP family ABC transporter substrate-binding protein [Pseudomonadota bacterium]
MSLNRRSFLKSSLAATTALALPVPAFAGDVLNVALIVPSPAADVGWSHTLELGTKALEAKYGDKVKVTLLENIAEGPDADRIMNKTVADGNTFLILGSFGYMEGGLKLAKAHPEVSILHASGYKTAPNFSPFGARYYQGTYLMGMAAASLSKSKKLGCVGAFAIPELITSINAFTLGAQAVDPAFEVSVVWVNSWFDPASEQQAAKALISQGVDVIFSNAQDTPSVIQTAEEAGVYAFNLNSSMKTYAPTKYLGVVGTDWAPYFLQSVEAHLAGTFQGASAWLSMADKCVFVADWNPDIPADIVAKITETEAAIETGAFSPFTGPITNQDGGEQVAAGVTLGDDMILSMDWHVKGVTTPLPK